MEVTCCGLVSIPVGYTLDTYYHKGLVGGCISLSHVSNDCIYFNSVFGPPDSSINWSGAMAILEDPSVHAVVAIVYLVPYDRPVEDSCIFGTCAFSIVDFNMREIVSWPGW